MDEKPDVAAVADRAEPLLAPALGLIIDLARVLNGEHVPAGGGRPRQHRPMRHHLLDRHRLVVQKAPQPHLLRPIVRKPPHADILPLAHPLHEQRPVLPQPFVAKIPDPHLRHRPPLIRDGRYRIMPDSSHANEKSPRQPNRTATK
jgi:hypothetical protein